MAWTETEWACGHHGYMQLYGKISARESRVAHEAGRKCFACWLVEQWEAKGDPRAEKPDRYILAGKIAEGKGIRIEDLPKEAPTKINPLAKFSDDEILTEAKARKLI